MNKGGDLNNKIKKTKESPQKKFETENIINWTKDILNGMKYLHDKKIIHRDLKPRSLNFYLD
jgi:serine/threonine protein kinase